MLLSTQSRIVTSAGRSVTPSSSFAFVLSEIVSGGGMSNGVPSLLNTAPWV